MRLEAADRRWAGRRVIVAAPGPSLADDVVEACRGEIVLAVSDAYRKFPDAAVLYSCDAAWWRAREFCPDFRGEKWTSHSIAPANDKRKVSEGLRVIEGMDANGFSRHPARIHYGNNSGFQAVNLAILFGADPIVLVGFDMRAVGGKQHFFGSHQPPLNDHSPFPAWIARFDEAAKLLGSSPRIVNATPESALTGFERLPLSHALRLSPGRPVPAMAASDPAWGSALVQYRDR